MEEVELLQYTYAGLRDLLQWVASLRQQQGSRLSMLKDSGARRDDRDRLGENVVSVSTRTAPYYFYSRPHYYVAASYSRLVEKYQQRSS